MPRMRLFLPVILGCIVESSGVANFELGEQSYNTRNVPSSACLSTCVYVCVCLCVCVFSPYVASTALTSYKRKNTNRNRQK